jgi:hypothetical protein
MVQASYRCEFNLCRSRHAADAAKFGSGMNVIMVKYLGRLSEGRETLFSAGSEQGQNPEVD